MLAGWPKGLGLPAAAWYWPCAIAALIASSPGPDVGAPPPTPFHSSSIEGTSPRPCIKGLKVPTAPPGWAILVPAYTSFQMSMPWSWASWVAPGRGPLEGS